MLRFVKVLCASFILTFGQMATLAHGQSYPVTNVRDNGARLGISAETAAYDFQGMKVIRVSYVAPGSPLAGTIEPGDFIYSVNGLSLRNAADIIWTVSSGAPGTVSAVYFLDTSANYRAMVTNVRTTSAYALQQAARPAPPPRSYAQTNNDGGSFCDRNPITCGIGLVLGVAAIGSLVGGSGSSDSNDGHADNDGHGYAPRGQGSTSSTDSRPPARTYGLYGDCPQPGAGYGC